MEREERKHKLAKIEADIFRQRYLLEDWSGSIMSSLRPISTRSDVSRHMSTTGDSWDARPTLVKVCHRLSQCVWLTVQIVPCVYKCQVII